MGSVIIEVAPLVWGEWWVYGSEEYIDKGIDRVRPNTRMYTSTDGWPYHKLIELGRTTSTYQYKVYGLGTVLLYETIRLPCCEWRSCVGDAPSGLATRCPLGRYGEPPMMELCREHLRAQAMGVAYQLWVEFMRKLGGVLQHPDSYAGGGG